MTRAGVHGLRRNLAVALGNSGDSRAADVLSEARSDETVSDPLVAEHVEWAKRKLSGNANRRLGDSKANGTARSTRGACHERITEAAQSLRVSCLRDEIRKSGLLISELLFVFRTAGRS